MTTISQTTLAPKAQTERAQLHKAAQAFEAILVKQMLTAAHASSFGDKLFDSQGLQTFNAMQDERFAQITAESGTLGLARALEAQLSKRLAPLPPAGGVGGGPVTQPQPTSPPLAPPASGRGTDGFGPSGEGAR